MTPYLAALDRRRHHRRRPDQAKPRSASAPITRAPSSPPNLQTTIPLKRNVDVDQQPQRRPGGSSRSDSRARVRAANHVNADHYVSQLGVSPVIATIQAAAAVPEKPRTPLAIRTDVQHANEVCLDIDQLDTGRSRAEAPEGPDDVDDVDRVKLLDVMNSRDRRRYEGSRRPDKFEKIEQVSINFVPRCERLD